MDGMDLNNAPLFKLERSDTASGNADLILPSDELSAFIQENNSSFSEKFNNKIISEILCSNHGDEQQLNTVETVWDSLDNLVEEDCNTVQQCTPYANKKIYCDGKKILVIPAMHSDPYQGNENNQFLIESSPETISSMNHLEEFVPLKEETHVHDSNELKSADPSLSLQSWAGHLNFSLNLKTREHNNKWCYSEELGILFSSISTAVPIDIVVDDWLAGAYVNVTPVFTDGESRLAPVPRCYNHAQNDVSGNSEHIVQVENKEAVYYKSKTGRHTVDIPIGVPPPGESTMQILVKVGCWNTCVGGPCRKQFCVIITLFSRNHEEIGRQMNKMKICSCPKRDMENTVKNTFKKEGLPIPQNMKKKNSPHKKIKTGKKLMSQTKRIKLEHNEIQLNNFVLYEQIMVPSKFRPKVEEYVNMLLAQEHAQKFYPNIMVYKGLLE